MLNNSISQSAYHQIQRVKLIAYAKYEKLTIKLVQWQDLANGFATSRPKWNYYIIVPVREINPTLVGKLAKCVGPDDVDYYDENFAFNKVFWHGGITYAEYHRKSYRSKDMSTYEVGCDYNHAEDEGCIYDTETVLNEALITAKEINELIK